MEVETSFSMRYGINQIFLGSSLVRGKILQVRSREISKQGLGYAVL